MSPASLSEEESSSSSVSIDRIDPFMSSIASLGQGDRRGLHRKRIFRHEGFPLRKAWHPPPLLRCSLARAEDMAAEEASGHLPGLPQAAYWAD